MTKNIKNNVKTKIESPLDLAKKSFETMFIQHEAKLKNLSFIEDFYTPFDNNYTKPSKNKFLMELFGMIFLIEFKQNEIRIKKKTNFTVVEAFNVTHIFNNHSNDKDSCYLLLTLKSTNGYLKSNIEIAQNAKFDINKFQETTSQNDNYFQMTFSQTEFKDFITEFVLSKISKNVITYENCGVVQPQQFLGSDFLIDKGKIYKADKSGLIPTLKKDVFIKSNDEQCFKLPKLSDSDKTAKVIAKNFIENTCESWGENSIFALLIIGHMIMGLFYETFIDKKKGVPILVVSGVTGCGKSTMIENGNAMFGLDESFLIAGNSTVYGQMSLAQMINGANICVDDMSDEVISSKSFGNFIKALYNGMSRAKRGDNKKTEKRKTCSQCVCSTNSTLNGIPEVINRANIITIMNNSLDTSKYKYLNEHKENRRDLSLILPKLLEFDVNEILNVHSDLEKYLRQQIDDTGVPRILSNVAYMWTGLTLLERVADYSLGELHSKIIDYAKNVIETYKSLETPVDMLLNGLLTLKNHGIIKENEHYKVSQPENDKIYLQFHKDTLLCAHNNFFRDENRKIKLKIFNNFLNCDNRVVNKGITGNFKGERRQSIIMDITNIPDVQEFSGYTLRNNNIANTHSANSDNPLDELEAILDLSPSRKNK